MKRVRNLFRVLCILAVTMSLINCQTDTVAEIQQEKTLQKAFPFKSSVLTKQDVEANTKLSNQMRSLATLQSSSLSESIHNSLYNFTVITDVVNFVESTENNSHYYTFPIERENDTGSALENLVFAYDEANDDYTASLVTYHFSVSQKQQFMLTKHVNTAYNISHESLSLQLSDILGESGLTSPCATNFTVYHITPDSGTFLYSSTIGNVQNMCQHEDEEGNTQCQVYTSITWDCPDSGSSSGSSNGAPSSGNPTTGSTDGGTNSGNGTTTPNDDEIITIPVIVKDCIISNNLGIECEILLEHEQDYKQMMTPEERNIYNSMSRLDQLSYLANGWNALKRAEELYPDSVYNGIGDAFRHARWNAFNVIDLGVELARDLTTAHENRPPGYNFAQMETQMDLFNNQIGRGIGSQITAGIDLETQLINAVNNGTLRYLNNLDPNTNRATANSQLIPTNQ